MAFSPLDSALLGPLFTTAEMAAVFDDRAVLAAMLRVEAALARAEARFGLAPDALAPAIERIGPDDFDLGSLGAATGIAGVPVIPFVKALEALLPEDLAPHLHKGATTQDVVDSALTLRLGGALDLLEADVHAILDGLLGLAETHRSTPCAGRTYGQHAAPVSFGFVAAGWARGFADVAFRLPEVRRGACIASLGGPVGTLHGLGAAGPAVVSAFAAELGLAAPAVTWHGRRAGLVRCGLWLATLMGAAAKVANDVARLAVTEIGEVAEPHLPGRGGSSAMPHKRNPLGATLVIAAASAARGHAVALLEAMAGEHQRPSGAWHAEWLALAPLFGLAAGALRETRGLAEGLVVDAARMRANLDLTRGLLFADRAAAVLAPLLGRSQAHACVEAAADRMRGSGGTLAEALGRDPRVAAVVGAGGIAAIFDIAPAVTAAAAWTDAACADIRRERGERGLRCPS